jgi:hypothetical protein
MRLQPGSEMNNEHITPQQLCDELGCAKSTVIRRGASLGIGSKIGVQIFFTREEADQLRSVIRPGQSGNPTIGDIYRKQKKAGD